MSTTKPKGFGSEAYGDPLGGGGSLHVIRARAVAGQVVRVTFDQEPIHRSPSGFSDALNPSNYSLTVVSGTATNPQAVGVGPTMVVGPAVSVQPGDERGFDVHTDRALISTIRYRVTAHGIKSKAGDDLGFPVAQEFMGMVLVHTTQPPQRRLDNTDILNSPFDGMLVVDDSGDLKAHSGIDVLKKRIFRRLTTSKNAFTFLPGYGVGLKLKEAAAPAQLQSLKSDIISQIKQEPEVAGVDAKLSLDGLGILTVTMDVKTRAGAAFQQGVQLTETGALVIL